MSVSGRKANKCTDADRWYKTGLYGSVVTALCCLTPVLVFILGLAGAAFLTTYLDYFLVPLFALFLLVAVYGWRRGGQFRKRG